MESIFCVLMVVEVFSLQKVVEMLEESGSWLVRGQMNKVDGAKLHSPVYSTFDTLVVQSGIAMEKNWAPSVDQSQL